MFSFKCLECNQMFNEIYHPQGCIELMNGYPIPCSHNGEPINPKVSKKLWFKKYINVPLIIY
jgi:hypothetical protein